MKKDDIIKLLQDNGYNNDASSTQEDLYTEINRSQLFSKTNRLNAGWARGKYIVARFDESNFTQEQYVHEWLEKVKKYHNQYLFLELNSDDWHFFDSTGSEIDIAIHPPKLRTTLLESTNSDSKSDKINTKEISFLPALRTKPFLLLAGISGTGKSRLVRKLAQATTTVELQQKYNKGWDCSNFDTERWMLHKPENFELIQVKPNWHNSMDVVGYLSNIPTPHYVFTPFIRFVAKAWQNPEVPFFLCLDEMNLAPVEEYFAEFLSAIESRSKDESGYITDPIVQPFDSFGSIGGTMIDELFPEFSAADVGTELSNVVAHFKTKGVTLPENLMVIGTVNMDETTFSFSRKVLDRAMSIEMNEVDYDAFLEGSTDQALQTMLKEIGADKLNDLLVNRHVSALETDVAPEGKAEVIAYLKRINLLLDGTPYKLGYRAANEALIYVQAANDFGMNNWQAAMDEFTLMKILSRLEGDEAKLTVLEGEKRLADAELNDNENIKQGGRATLLSCLREIISQTLGKDDSCRSIAKLDSMLEQLRREHFVSYWN